MGKRLGALATISVFAALLIVASGGRKASATAASCLALGDEPIAMGDVTDNDWDTWVGSELDFASNEEHLQVAQTGDGMVLRQEFVPSTQGSARVTVKGDLEPAQTYRMTQRVFFEPGFDWGREKQGGKLGFGLGGGTSPTGGDIDPDGFSARFMWRGNQDGTARIVVYSYAADRNQNLPFGDDYPLSDFTAPIGSWFSLTMEVTANSAPGIADGSVRAWADGELALDQSGIVWQDTGTPVVDRFIYASFYGGNSWDWAPSQTTHVQFDDVCWESLIAEPDPDPEPEPIVAPETDGLRDQIAAVEARVQGALPTGSGQVDWRLNYALEQIASASDPAEWVDADRLNSDSEALRDLQRGIAKLISAAGSNGASTEARSLSLNTSDQLAAVAVILADDAVAEAEQQLAQSECSCRNAQRQLDRALNEQASMRSATDATDIANHARRAWSRAQLALEAIP